MGLALAGAFLQACGSGVVGPSDDPSSSGSASASGSSTSSGGGAGGAGGAASGSGGSSGSSGDLVDPIELAGSFNDTASSLALGPTDVYWASLSIVGENKYEYGVKKAPKEPGGEAYELGGVWALAIAVDATHLYWTDGLSVAKKPLGGSEITELATGQAFQHGSSIALDEASVYWTNRDLGTVMKAAKDGSFMGAIASGQTLPTRVAVDDTHVYWTSSTDPGAIVSAPKDGGAPVILADNQHYPSAIAVDATRVVWTSTGDQSIKMAPKGGGQATLIAGGQFATSIALADTHVYWLLSDAGVVRAPFDGGPPTTLSVSQTGCSEIALDDEFIYWTRDAVTKGAKVLKLAK